METNSETNPSGSSSTPEESLIQARQAEAVTRHPRLPSWYFAAMAAVVAVLMLCQMLPTGKRTLALFAVLLSAMALNNRAQSLAGISWAGQPIRGQLPFLIVMLMVIAATAVAAGVTGQAWVWAVGAAPAAVVVLVTGTIYRRRTA